MNSLKFSAMVDNEMADNRNNQRMLRSLFLSFSVNFCASQREKYESAVVGFNIIMHEFVWCFVHNWMPVDMIISSSSHTNCIQKKMTNEIKSCAMAIRSSNKRVQMRKWIWKMNTRERSIYGRIESFRLCFGWVIISGRAMDGKCHIPTSLIESKSSAAKKRVPHTAHNMHIKIRIKYMIFHGDNLMLSKRKNHEWFTMRLVCRHCLIQFWKVPNDIVAS